MVVRFNADVFPPESAIVVRKARTGKVPGNAESSVDEPGGLEFNTGRKARRESGQGNGESLQGKSLTIR